MRLQQDCSQEIPDLIDDGRLMSSDEGIQSREKRMAGDGVFHLHVPTFWSITMLWVRSAARAESKPYPMRA